MKRALLTTAFVALLLTAARFASGGEPSFQRVENARNILRAIVNQSESLPEPQRASLQEVFLQLDSAVNIWNNARGLSAPAIFTERPAADATAAVTRLGFMLDESADVGRVSASRAALLAPVEMVRHWPTGRGIVLLRIGRDDLAPDVNAEFAQAEADLSRTNPIRLETGPARTIYAAVFVDNAPSGSHIFPIHVVSLGVEVALVNLALEVPPTGELHVTVLDASSGKQTPAVAGVYSRDEQLMVPPEALAFDEGGFYYTGGRVRPNSQVHYWPGSAAEHKVFFIDGHFSLRLPEGTYNLITGKGTEFIPSVESVSVIAGQIVSRQVSLRRWIDMPSRGWYSGDTHVHYARADREANRRLLLWTQAEDVHVASVLRMGDARETYFEQYGFGKAGRFVSGDYALVAGQEDPRTNVIGHTLHLNLQAPFRSPENYYLYDLVFDETHRQGGLNGYAHMYRPLSYSFNVSRDMSLNMPTNRIDFAELCEFGVIGEDVYYEFLNLGFPLAVSAGSDVPWGNTIGTSRVYAYTGPKFDADAWFAALKAGHTFVTTGPMLEFTVNGQLPGSEIVARAGDKLRIKAMASGDPVAPEFLEVVEQGAVIRSAQPAGNKKTLSVEFEIPVRHSSWIAARCAGGHTTPVYIKVGNERFWKLDQVERLVGNRMKQLDQIDELSTREIPMYRQGDWENPGAWKSGAAQLRQRVEVARGVYRKLLREAQGNGR